ncbi:hypothetical protein TWF730_011158 [Orbilia blumenaviensis]|uniref:Uncharacterized protein n=1 Tax=Orbilia blumenaviensis TaxID=1796055 RepID=A0AAV9UJM8_9PEZI
MRGYTGAGVLLSLVATALADPFSSTVDMDSNISPLNARGEDGTVLGAMSNLHKRERESLYSLMKRSFSEMDAGHLSVVIPRQIDSIPTDPKTGNTGTSNFNVEEWDQQVEFACAEALKLLPAVITKVMDPAGVAVCYNIPFYNSTSGAFASDIRLYKIANGTREWENPTTKISLSVEYDGATVRLANARAAAAGQNKVASAKEVAAGNLRLKAVKGGTMEKAGKVLDKAVTTQKAAAQKTSSAAAKKPSAASSAAKPASSAAKPVSSAAKPVSSSAAAAKAAKTPSAAALKKRMGGMTMSNRIEGEGSDSDDDFEIKLLQTMRFVGQVNPSVMRNQTIAKNPSIMKLVLTPSLKLIGVTPEGNMNASVAAAQIQYMTGAFSSIITPTPEPAPFVLPGVYISIFPLGLYLCTVYTILFVLIVGWGTVERYLFRMSFRKRSAMMNGQDGFGKI